MNRHSQTGRTVRYAICTAMATVLVTGCAGTSPLTQVSESQSVASRSENDRIIAKTEEAVAKTPHDVAAREALANAYLWGGRFESAITTFEDVESLGGSSARTALSLALAHVGAGHRSEAVAILDQWRDGIPAGDFGLALALAGETSRGVAVLADALRSGENTPKLRQNLAYAYALDGRWREARLMAAQDVPADQLDARISQWALQGRPEDYRARVAGLIGAPVRADAGQPHHLALVQTPADGALAMAHAAPEAGRATRPDGELPPIEDGESFWIAETAVPADVAAPVAATSPVPSAPAASEEVRETPSRNRNFTSRPVVQTIPARAARNAEPATRATAIAAKTSHDLGVTAGTHLVQLGSFSSLQNAQRAWAIFVSRNPKLQDHEMVVTEATVRGKKYWRVAAAGFDQRSARSMCSSVKGRGGGCIAYAGDRPLPGVISSGARQAHR